VQTVIRLRLRPECALRLTTAHYLTPLGRTIHGKGIVPDVAVPQPPAAWRRAQLKRLQEESPEVYPAGAREALGDAVDAPLERAIDILAGARILGGK
jgi:carboxyl-terminal processing protease